MNRFDQTENQEITCAEEGALVLIANACGLSAPAPPSVWELILQCVRKTPQMKLSSLAFAVADFAPEPVKILDKTTLGDVLDSCKRIILAVDEDFLSRN